MRKRMTRAVWHADRLTSGSVAALFCLVLTLSALATASEELIGQWQGTIALPGGDTLPVVLKLDKPAGGEWTAGVQVTPGGEQFQPVQTLSVNGTAVTFRFQAPSMQSAATFSGNYQAWNDIIKGVLIYGGNTVGLRLDRVGPPPGAAGLAAAAAETVQTTEQAGRVRHLRRFGIGGRGARWVPIYIIKEDRRNINDITTAEFGFDANVRWYVMDGLAFFGRYLRGGLKFDTNDKNLGLFSGIGLTRDAYLKMEGWQFGGNAYLGNILMKRSRFNPYLTAAAGQMDWTVGSHGRDSSPIEILDKPLTGTDVVIDAGLGVEYPINRTFVLELEWAWHYLFSEDKNKWADVENEWTNTNFWALSFGVIINFLGT